MQRRVGDSGRFSVRFSSALERNSGWFLLGILAVTALLVIPTATMAPTEAASDNPGGHVYDLEEIVNSTLPSRVHSAGFIVEVRGDDMLTRAPLWELLQNTERLREADAAGELAPPGLPEQPYLYSG